MLLTRIALYTKKRKKGTKMKKFLAVLLAVLMLSAMVTGCGIKPAETGDPETLPEPTQTATEPPETPSTGDEADDEPILIGVSIMEMTAFSRPGVIEVLPALPSSLERGSIKGMMARAFTKINELSWDLQNRTVDITVTSLKNQDITLIARYGIDDISAPAGIIKNFRKGNADCVISLSENEPVNIHLELGDYKPLDWIDQVS